MGGCAPLTHTHTHTHTHTQTHTHKHTHTHTSTHTHKRRETRTYTLLCSALCLGILHFDEGGSARANQGSRRREEPTDGRRRGGSQSPAWLQHKAPLDDTPFVSGRHVECSGRWNKTPPLCLPLFCQCWGVATDLILQQEERSRERGGERERGRETEGEREMSDSRCQCTEKPR